MIKASLILSLFFVGSLSQANTCECDDYFEGAVCDECVYTLLFNANVSAPEPCKIADNLETNIIEQPNSEFKLAKLVAIQQDPLLRARWLGAAEAMKWTPDELRCFGRGTWDWTGESKDWGCMCDNTTGFEAGGFGDLPIQTKYSKETFCLECGGGLINWPACNAFPCGSLQTVVGVTVCSNNGLCLNTDLEKPRCAPLITSSSVDATYDPVTDNCFTYNDWQPKVNRTQYAGFGNFNEIGEIDSMGFPVYELKTQYRVEPIGTGVCGSSICTFSEICRTYDYRNNFNIMTRRFSCIETGEGTELCAIKRYNRDDQKFYTYDHTVCMPYEKCCNGVCCSSTQVCEVRGMLDIGVPLVVTAVDGASVGVVNPRFDFVFSQGAPALPEDQRAQCVEDAFPSAPSVVLAIVLPIVLLLVVLVSVVIVIASAGVGSVKVLIPAGLVIFFSLFLLFSPVWWGALLAVLGSLSAIGAQAGKSESKHIFSSIFQFIIFIIVCLNLLVSAEGSEGYDWLVLEECSDYYNYFKVTNPAWDADPNEIYNYTCSHGWQSAVMFFSALIVGFYFVQVVASASLMAAEK